MTYLSIHRYEHGNFWPHKAYADFNYTGEGKGRGHNINIPINENGGTHHDYLYILFTVVIPIARELQPDMIFISAGFDACIGDPIVSFCFLEHNILEVKNMVVSSLAQM